MDETREGLADSLKGLKKDIEEADSRGNYTQLLPLLQEQVELTGMVHTENSLEYAAALNDLGGTYRDIGRYMDAEELFLRATDVLAALVGRENPNYATSLNNTAGLYRLMGRLEEAEALFKESLAVCEKTVGPEHYLTVSGMNNLGLVYQDAKRYDEARELHERCLAILEAQGDNPVAIVTTVNNLAALMQKLGEYGKAQDLTGRVCDMYRELVGAEHPLYACALNNYAICLYNAKDYAGALERFKEAEDIARRMFGEGSSVHSMATKNLAGAYLAVGEQEKAQDCLDRAAAYDAAAAQK